jgi:hypothetical protein
VNARSLVTPRWRLSAATLRSRRRTKMSQGQNGPAAGQQMPRRHRRQARTLAAARRLGNKYFRSPPPRSSAPIPTSANSLQSAAMCARIELLNGGVRKLLLASAMLYCVEEFHSAQEPGNQRPARVALTGLFRLPDAELSDLLPPGVAHFGAGAWPRAEIDPGQVRGHRYQVAHSHSRRGVVKRNQNVLPSVTGLDSCHLILCV